MRGWKGSWGRGGIDGVNVDGSLTCTELWLLHIPLLLG